MIWEHMITFKKLQLVKDMSIKVFALLDYPYFIENWKLIAMCLIKEKLLNADSKAKQQIIFKF